MSTEPTPQPEKTISQLQVDLVEEILQILELDRRRDLDPLQYDHVRAAIAHYTVTLSEAK
jgi:hypothetical protein